ncbi:Fe-S cluster assembly sulfur transfer protein SufU [Hutsoniella sourekii]
MALFDLNQLYKAVIMEHSKSPRHLGHVNQADKRIELLNPTCGDAIVVEYRLDPEGKIEEVKFNGEGCAISQASADMMCQVLKGQSQAEALSTIAGFDDLIGGLREDVTWKPDQLKQTLQDAYLLQGVKKFPARYKCGILAWRAIEMGLTGAQGQGPSEI